MPFISEIFFFMIPHFVCVYVRVAVDADTQVARFGARRTVTQASGTNHSKLLMECCDCWLRRVCVHRKCNKTKFYANGAVAAVAAAVSSHFILFLIKKNYYCTAAAAVVYDVCRIPILWSRSSHRSQIACRDQNFSAD